MPESGYVDYDITGLPLMEDTERALILLNGRDFAQGMIFCFQPCTDFQNGSQSPVCRPVFPLV